MAMIATLQFDSEQLVTNLSHFLCLKQFCSVSWIAEWRRGLERETEEQQVSKIFFNYIWLLPVKNFPSRWCFLGNSSTGSKPSRTSKSCVCLHKNVIKCDASGTGRRAVMLQMLFGVDRVKLANIHTKSVKLLTFQLRLLNGNIGLFIWQLRAEIMCLTRLIQLKVNSYLINLQW